MLVPQSAGEGRYTSEVIHGRWQILESFLSDRYYIVDLAREEPVTDDDGTVRRFLSIDDARQYIDLELMPHALEPVVKSGDSSPKKKQRRKSTSNRIETSNRMESVMTERMNNKPSTDGKRTRVRGAHARILQLLREHPDWSDEQIASVIAQEFPGSSLTRPYDVRYRRRKFCT